MSITFVDLDDTPVDRQRLERFFRELFVPGFPDPDERESLDTLECNLIKRAAGFYGANSYRIVLGLDGEYPVAGCIADYMAESNCAAIEYIVVSEDRRGEGLGRRIHDHTIEILTRDARAAGRAGLDAIMVEVNDPYQVSAEADNVDPFDRAMMWHRWGYQRLRFPYEQPALSHEQAPVTSLLLALKVLNPVLAEALPASLARQIVVDYLVWANRFEAFETDPFYRRMTAYAEARRAVPVEGLDTYIGRNPDKPLTVRPLPGPDHPDYAAMLEVYFRAFGEGDEAVPPEHFARALAAHRPDGTHYYVWAFSIWPDDPVGGMATFYAMPDLGFLGYLALEAPLRGRGLARVALKRIEERMIRDHAGIRYLYLECALGSPQEAAFRTMGFTDLGLAYHQPPLSDATCRMTTLGPAMTLMRKKLGDALTEQQPSEEEVKQDIARFLGTIYGLAEPQRSACYFRMFKSS